MARGSSGGGGLLFLILLGLGAFGFYTCGKMNSESAPVKETPRVEPNNNPTINI